MIGGALTEREKKKCVSLNPTKIQNLKVKMNSLKQFKNSFDFKQKNASKKQM